MMRSLRARLLLWVLLPMSLVLALTAWLSWRDASATAALVRDRALLASAQVLAGQVSWSDGTLSAVTPPAALEMFDTAQRDSVYFQVRTAGGHLLSGWPELTALPAGEQPAWGDAQFRGVPVRQVTLLRAVYDSDERPVAVLVSVAETGLSFDAMRRSLWRPALAHALLLLALALGLMLLGLTLELRPLSSLRSVLLARSDDDPAPLHAPGLQRELLPLVDALNASRARLQRQLLLQKRFTADAAHQLRTPVALLGTQLHVAAGQAGGGQLGTTLRALQDSVRQLAQLINQLLSLSQAEGQGGAALQPLDLLQLAREVVVELALLAEQRGIDLGLDTELEQVTVAGQTALLHACLYNLLDNALRYTPRGGHVTVQLRADASTVELCVVDDGPGIPAALRQRVFERFFRCDTATGPGSGLGLAIAQAAASACRGRLELDDGPGGRGLRACLSLPRSGQA